MHRDLISFGNDFVDHLEEFHEVSRLEEKPDIRIAYGNSARACEVIGKQPAVTPALCILGDDHMPRFWFINEFRLGFQG